MTDKNERSNNDFIEEKLVELCVKNNHVLVPHSTVYIPLDYYFYNSGNKHIRMTNIGIYSATPWKEGNQVCNYIKEHFFTYHNVTNVRNITITDGTAHVGGNAINFGVNGFKLNAVEINPLTYDILKHNLKQYKIPVKTVYLNDYVKVYDKLQQDVVYLDLPWGGPNYKSVKCLDLYLGKTNLITLCCNLMTNKLCKLLVLKVPINYNLNGLINSLPNLHFHTHKVLRSKQKHSYNIIYCW